MARPMASISEIARDAAAPPAAAPPADAPATLLDRPAADRCREFKYRFAQSAVFGIPVLVLHAFGRSLGGSESDRWTALFQALLAGWVVYVAAAGMLSEGLLLILARRPMPATIRADLAAASAALLAYLCGLPHLLTSILAPASRWPATFHLAVLILALWTGLRWWHLAKKNSAR